MTGEKKPHGLRGWLIPVGVNVVLSPVVLAHTLYFEYTNILSTVGWIAQSTPGNTLYHPGFKTLIIAEVTLNVALFLLSLYLVQQFFAKKTIFPRTYSIVLMLSVVLAVFDALSITLIFPEFLILTPENIWYLGRAVLSAALCVPYLKYSERVKNTFVS